MLRSSRILAPVLAMACGNGVRAGVPEDDASWVGRDAHFDDVLGEDGPLCIGLECNIDPCGGDATRTQLTGSVYDPAGKNPLPNVLVYVPNAPLSALTEGPSCEACFGGSGGPIVGTLTDYRGRFTLEGVPSGTNVPLVVQVGKWRRQVSVPTVTKCVSSDTTALTGADGRPLVRLPKNRSEGSMPRIAIVSGAADPFECVLAKIGIDVTAESGEIGPPVVAGLANPDRIHFYTSPDAPGLDTSATLGGPSPSASGLWDTAAHLSAYDAILLPCEGADFDKGAAVRARLVDYAGRGGRIFATHHSYSYLQFAPAASLWPNVVKFWNHTPAKDGPTSVVLNRTFPRGDTFARWLHFIGASPDLGRLPIQGVQHDYAFVDRTRATPWMYSNVDGTMPKDTTGACTRDTDCPTTEAGGGCWGGTCVPAHGQEALMTFNVPVGPPAAQCGRVVFADFHASASASPGKGAFPEGCDGGDLSAQEKVFEFMLFDFPMCVWNHGKW